MIDIFLIEQAPSGAGYQCLTATQGQDGMPAVAARCQDTYPTIAAAATALRLAYGDDINIFRSYQGKPYHHIRLGHAPVTA